MESDLVARIETYLAEKRREPGEPLPTALFDVVPTDWLVEHGPEPRPVAIPGILGVGDLAIITAPHDSYKSTFALQLGRSLATGESLLGRFEVVRPLSMVVLQAEIDPGSYRERVAVFGGSPHLHTCSDFTFNFNQLPDFVRYLDIYVPDWDGIIFDPVGEMWPTYSQAGEPFSENQKTHVTPILKALKLLGKTIILVHHDPKKSQGFQGRASGTAALLNTPDVRIHLDRDYLTNTVKVEVHNRLQNPAGTFHCRVIGGRKLIFSKNPPQTP